jgi:hypothetical protein
MHIQTEVSKSDPTSVSPLKQSAHICQYRQMLAESSRFKALPQCCQCRINGICDGVHARHAVNFAQQATVTIEWQ